MRILLVASDIVVPGHHGGATHVGELAAHLEGHGPTLLLACAGSTGDCVAAIGRPMRRSPAVLRHLDAALLLPAALKAARHFRPDVVYERGSSYGLGGLISLALGRPLLTMVLDHHVSPLSLKRAGRIIATRLDIVPAAARAKARRVSWGANPALFDAGLSQATARARLDLDQATPVVAYSGSFRAWHGLDVLVGAADRLRDRGVVYLLVGDGPVRAETEAAAAARGLRDRFVFTGAVPYAEVPGVLAAADVCVAPFEPDRLGASRQYGFTLDPLKVFEYLALGKPTVTIRAANFAALFDDGVHLLLASPGREDALAAALGRLLDDPAYAATLARAGRERVLERHTWAAHADHLAAMFHEMLAGA